MTGVDVDDLARDLIDDDRPEEVGTVFSSAMAALMVSSVSNALISRSVVVRTSSQSGSQCFILFQT